VTSPQKVYLFSVILLLNGIGCLHDTGLPLQNDAPEITFSTGDPRFSQGMFSDTLVYPDSIVCTLLVYDRNDFTLSVHEQNAQWPGYLHQPISDYAEKHLIPVCTASLMGAFYAGTWSIKDRYGVGDSIRFSVLHTARDRFRGLGPDPAYWVPYNDSHLGSSIVVDRPPDDPLYFLFKEDMNTHVTGMHSPYVLSGDFEIRLSYRLVREENDITEFWFVISTGTDTSWFMRKDDYAGIRLSVGGAELGLLSEGNTIQDGNRARLAGTLSIERTAGHLAFYQTPEFALESYRLGDSTTVFLFPHDSLRVHVRLTTDETGVRRGPCVLREFCISKGLIERMEG